MILNKIRTVAIAACLSLSAIPSVAQDLLAKQAPIDKKMKAVDSVALSRLIQNEQLESPSADLYNEWDNRYAHKATALPDSFNINLRGFCMPTTSRVVTSNFGHRWGRQHKGIDVKVYIGDTIRAAFSGKVRIVRYEARGYGKYVVVRHTNDLETVYGHLSGYLVEPGQYVHAGDPIALGGNTGRSTGPHLHFETRYMGYPINPCAIFDFANQTTHTDTYTFNKDTYQEARNFDPAANSEYASRYRRENPPKAYSRSASSSSNGASTYRVRRGDSLSRIAARNGTTVRNLCRLNGITTSTKLQIGQRLRLR